MITALALSVWPSTATAPSGVSVPNPLTTVTLRRLSSPDKPLCRVDTMPLLRLLTARQSAAGYATAPSPIPKSPAWHQEHHSHGSVGPAGGGCAGRASPGRRRLGLYHWTGLGR